MDIKRHIAGLPTFLLLLLVLAGLVGCASPPIGVEEQVLDERTPAEVARQVQEANVEANVEADSVDAPGVSSPATSATTGTVLWGGVLVGSTNLDAETLFEVLAYPLDRRQRPMIGRPPEGRFRVLVDGYVETLDYAEGRQITILGALEGVVDGKVAEATRRFPVVRARQLHLWRPGQDDDRPRFTFGLGIGIGN